jgi:putative tricarboxylic transport membrane protein
MSGRRKDIFLGCSLAMICFIVLMVVIPRSVAVPSTIKITSLRPDFWPSLLCALLIFLGLLVVVLALARPPGVSQLESGTEEGADNSHTNGLRELLRQLLVVGALLLYYFLLDPLGIVIASVLALFSFAWFYGEKNVKVLAPLSIAMPVLLYLFFTKIAHIPLPTGSLFGW